MNRNLTPRLGLRAIVLSLSALAMTLPAVQAQAAGNSWFSAGQVQGNGNIKKQNREIGHFTGVAFSLPGNVELRMGNTESITIETDDNLLPLIETVVEDGTLRIRTIKKNTGIETRHLKIVVQAKDIERLALGGSGSIDSDALKGKKVQIDLGGSGSINVKGVEADAMSVTLGGSGNLKAGGGATKKLSLSIGGSGEVQLAQIKATDVSVSIGGSGQSTVWATDALSVSIAGSGDVNYYGDPKTSKSVVGSGGLRRLGGSPR
jgi:hypothetical protein